MLGDAMTSTPPLQVTSEEVSRGATPSWLMEHMMHQALGPTDTESGGSGRILVVYPTEESRRQTMSLLDGAGTAVDRTLHHTVESLKSSLVSDLRLPRVLTKGGAFDLILHEACRQEAARLAFPLINPLPDMNWGRGKTAALAELHSFLSSESAAGSWEGPGITSFRMILRRLEKELRGTHPDMVASRVVEGLESGSEPFTLIDVDGIIMLDHPPGTPRAHTELILALSRHCPVHQLAHPGNFRLGHHGHLLLDEHPLKRSAELPSWVPNHEPDASDSLSDASRLLLHREEHSFDAAIGLARERLESSKEDRVIIVDPALESNMPRWERALRDLGIPATPSQVPVSSHSLGHWLGSLANLAHGADAFSLESLRSLSLQRSISALDEPEQHPSEGRVRPHADSDLLTELARGEHVLGGPGALRRWLQTMSRPTLSERDGIRKESTQWWLLCVANSLRPLLSGEDRAALQEEHVRVGCHTGAILPLSEPTRSGDAWLLATLGLIDLESVMELCDGEGTSPAAVVQAVVRDHSALRAMQGNIGQETPRIGPDWVDEFTSLIQSSSIQQGGSNATSRVRVLTPSDALGCTAELVILTNLSSSSWDLRVPKMAFLGDEERHSLDLLRPDGPVRDARHHLEHLLAAAPETILLDPSLDDASPAAAPIREWATANDPDDEAEILDSRPSHPVSPRDFRQSDGSLLRSMRPPIHPPINPNSVSISMDLQLQRDRERRQPSRSEDDGYLPDGVAPHLFSIEFGDLFRKTPAGVEPPRAHARWPLVGGYTQGGKRTPTIDPRPFSPAASSSMVSDSRHGHSPGAEQDVAIWSASRLHEWLQCPRRGWLSRGLKAEQEELQAEDLDPRTHGELLHLVHHDMLCEILDLDIGDEREFGGNGSIRSIAQSGTDENELMRIALESLDSRAPWLDRTDAVSTHRLRLLTGMDRGAWNSWLADPRPIPPAGRVGTIVRAESRLGDAAPVCLEWSMTSHDEEGIEVSLPAELTCGGTELPTIRVRGYVDRVDILPMDEEGLVWMDADGNETVAPIRVHESGWKPRRLVAIRDLKTSESKSAKDRHSGGLLDELQLALYARAWEIAHPGDLVVAAGISLFSHNTEHMLEMSTWYSGSHAELQVGTRTDVTASLHRFADEGPSPGSDHFRAWLAQRLSVALGVAAGAASGSVHPTPSKGVCRYCPVSNTCEVRMEADY